MTDSSGPQGIGFDNEFDKTLKDIESIPHHVKTTGEPVFKMNEDGTIDETPEKQVRFPPLPVPLRPWGKDDYRYSGEMESMNSRVQHKLYQFWMMWYNLRTCTRLEEILATPEQDKNSDAYICKATIVDIMDHVAKILVDTPLIEEMLYLFDDKKKVEKKV